MDSLSLLKNLCHAITPSGAEVAGQRIVAEFAKPYADSIRLDPLGNLHVVRNPSAPCRVMIDAHCDEIGLLVQYIDSNGFLYFSTVGGVNKQLLPGERIILNGPNGLVNGVIGRKPIHLMTAKERDSGVGELSDLWIDIGASSAEMAQQVAPIGTFGVVEAEWRPLLSDIVSARAFDDRCGVYVIMDALRRLQARPLNVAAHFVCSTQEELGLLGAGVAAYGIDPMLGICVDVTFASDTPQSNPKLNGELKLGAGPVIGVGPNYDPAFVAFVKDIAAKHDIPLQVQARPRGNGTNAFTMRHTRAGVPVVQLSIALRYMHSAVETISLKDLEACSKLIAEVLAALPEKPEFGFRL